MTVYSRGGQLQYFFQGATWEARAVLASRTNNKSNYTELPLARADILRANRPASLVGGLLHMHPYVSEKKVPFQNKSKWIGLVQAENQVGLHNWL